jgi:hypothetical protein
VQALCLSVVQFVSLLMNAVLTVREIFVAPQFKGVSRLDR